MYTLYFRVSIHMAPLEVYKVFLLQVWDARSSQAPLSHLIIINFESNDDLSQGEKLSKGGY